MAMTEELIISGFGGQGVMVGGRLLAYAGMVEDKNVTWLPSYGPEMRGGTANCSVIISDQLIGSPVVSEVDSLIVMNLPSLSKFETAVKPGGDIFINSSLIEQKSGRSDINVYYVPANKIAIDCGSDLAANLVMLGAWLAVRKRIAVQTVTDSFVKVFGESKRQHFALNEKALNAGVAAVNS